MSRDDLFVHTLNYPEGPRETHRQHDQARGYSSLTGEAVSFYVLRGSQHLPGPAGGHILKAEVVRQPRVNSYFVKAILDVGLRNVDLLIGWALETLVDFRSSKVGTRRFSKQLIRLPAVQN